MRSFKFQDIIYEYQLDLAKLPEALYSAIVKFHSLSNKALQEPESASLLELADRNLSILLIEFIKANAENLEDLICENCTYKEFYIRLFGNLVHGESKSYLVEPELDVAYVLFNPRTIVFGTCQYYALTRRNRNEDAIWDLTMLCMVKVCHNEKALEPISFQDYKSKEKYQAYDYWSDNPVKVNWDEKAKVDHSFEEILAHLEFENMPFEPMNKAMNLLITQIEIANNEK